MSERIEMDLRRENLKGGMKKVKSFTLIELLLTIVIGTSGFCQEKQTIAVLDFESYGINEFEAQSLTNRTRTLLVRSGKYQVVERGKMNEILNEQGFQQSGCTTEECIVEVGQLLGVRYMVGGSIGLVGSTFTIDMRIIDIQTGKIFKSASYDIEGKIDDVLKTGLQEVLDKLTGTKQGIIETGSIAISFIPADAVLYIEKVPKGKSPVRISDLPAGRELLIEIQHPEFEPIAERITLSAGINSPLQYTLRRLHGKLSVDGVPTVASIKLGDTDIGKSPLLDFQYPIGTYNLIITKPEFKKYIKEVDLIVDTPANIVYNLEPVSKSKALIYSAVLPGAGQFYQRHAPKGVLLMAAALGSGWMIIDAQNQYTDQKTNWMAKRDIYNSNIDQPDLWSIQKAAATDAYNQMIDTQKTRNLYIGALGVVWSVNLIDIIF